MPLTISQKYTNSNLFNWRYSANDRSDRAFPGLDITKAVDQLNIKDYENPFLYLDLDVRYQMQAHSYFVLCKESGGNFADNEKLFALPKNETDGQFQIKLELPTLKYFNSVFFGSGNINARPDWYFKAKQSDLRFTRYCRETELKDPNVIKYKVIPNQGPSLYYRIQNKLMHTTNLVAWLAPTSYLCVFDQWFRLQHISNNQNLNLYDLLDNGLKELYKSYLFPGSSWSIEPVVLKVKT